MVDALMVAQSVFDDNMNTLCHLRRLLQCYHECTSHEITPKRT